MRHENSVKVLIRQIPIIYETISVIIQSLIYITFLLVFFPSNSDCQGNRMRFLESFFPSFSCIFLLQQNLFFNEVHGSIFRQRCHNQVQYHHRPVDGERERAPARALRLPSVGQSARPLSLLLARCLAPPALQLKERQKKRTDAIL